MIDIQYSIKIMGGREVSRPYRILFFRQRRAVFIHWNSKFRIFESSPTNSLTRWLVDFQKAHQLNPLKPDFKKPTTQRVEVWRVGLVWQVRRIRKRPIVQKDFTKSETIVLTSLTSSTS